ncbi:MAG: NAD(P)/FAD-dependent oxidoreductase [Alphaproteobacteria bacterium]
MVLSRYDVIILGAGAAGLSAAGVLVARGKRVVVFDMGKTPGRKIMASGGGRCNITNLAVRYDRYFGMNPDFVRGAISRVSPRDIVEWADSHNIKLVEKSAGQYFCADGAGVVLNALMDDACGADFVYDMPVSKVEKSANGFVVNGCVAKSVIVATGGTSFGALGVSDAGYKIAKDFGHKIVPVRPALCALSFDGAASDLAGISLDAQIKIGKNIVRDSLLFTHFGIGGPAAYRASLYDVHVGICVDLLPGVDVLGELRKAKMIQGKKSVAGVLGQWLPARIAKWVAGDDVRNIADIKDSEIVLIAERVSKIYISGDKIKYHGLSSAEVVCGGVDTNDVSSKTMESKLCPGLFFAGEVLDVAGDLGGFNLHWAWASGRVAGENA